MGQADPGWAALLRALARLRVEAGDPSLRDLVACGGRSAPGVSTVSEVLNGKRDKVSWEFVRFFVTACEAYARRHEPDRPLAGTRLVDWHAAWSRLATATGAARVAAGPAGESGVAAGPAGVPGDARAGAPALPAVWNLQPRNPAFVGRDGDLATVRARLRRPGAAGIVALHGMGGVGKSQLAVEFAHRFAADYDIVWWFAAEQAGLLGGQYAALAGALGLSGALDDQATVAAVRLRLRGGGRWLAIFDNAREPDEVGRWLPAGPGHVLITSRNPGWVGVAERVEVRPLPAGDGVRLLHAYRPDLPAPDALRLAEALDGLPLALAQSAGFLAETGGAAADYLHHLDTACAELLELGRPPGYPQPLAAAVRLAVAELSRMEPEAAHLLHVLARLAPEPVPLNLLAAAPPAGTHPAAAPLNLLAAAPPAGTHPAGDGPGAHRPGLSPLAASRAAAAITRFGLARVSPAGIQVHRLTQAILRDRSGVDGDSPYRRAAEGMLTAAAPQDTEDPVYWPQWAALAPHLLALRPEASDNPRLREAACKVARYLLVRGSPDVALDVASRLYRCWVERLGPDDRHTVRAANQLGRIHFARGRYERARRYSEDSYRRWRRLLGEDHPDTLSAANNYAMDLSALGENELARTIDADILDRRRRTQGEDHPLTLLATVNLAVDHSTLGEHDTSRRLNEQAVRRYRRRLGDDHPDTLRALANLARDLSNLGEHERADLLYREHVERSTRVLGPDHPETLWALGRLGEGRHAAAEYAAAVAVHQDVLHRQATVLGEEHPATLHTAANLARSLRSLGRTGEAAAVERRTLPRLQRVLGPDHPETKSLTGAAGTGPGHGP